MSRRGIWRGNLRESQDLSQLPNFSAPYRAAGRLPDVTDLGLPLERRYRIRLAADACGSRDALRPTGVVEFLQQSSGIANLAQLWTMLHCYLSRGRRRNGSAGA